MPKPTPDYQRLAGLPTRWPSLPLGAACKVFMGSGWASGTWEGLQSGCGRVRLPKDQRMVIVRDARNVRVG
jgi:hypothetical protein